MSPPPVSVHASCVAVGEAGVLIRGASGSGKSRLAAELVSREESAGRFGRLVSDDRVLLEAANGRLIASAPAAIAGLIERRGLGVTTAPHLAAAVVRLVVDIADAPERMPDEADLSCDVRGLRLPRLAVPARDPGAAELVLHRLASVFRTTGIVTR